MVISSVGIKGPRITEGNVEGESGALTSCSGFIPSCLGPGVVAGGGYHFPFLACFSFYLLLSVFWSCQILEGRNHLFISSEDQENHSFGMFFFVCKGIIWWGEIQVLVNVIISLYMIVFPGISDFIIVCPILYL